MNHFTAIDFETSCYKQNSICQVGLVRVEAGQVVEEIDLLVQPPDNIYRQSFTYDVHGIGPADTEDSPTFDQVWPKLEPFITGQTVVAHNGFGFDFKVLPATLEHYHLPKPEYNGVCTYRIYRGSLDALCKKYKIPLQHHNALSDARACAELYLRYLEGGG